MTRVNALVALPDALSVTCTVKLELPELVGVPLMTPVAAFKVRGVGNEPTVITQVYPGVPPTATRG
jgi:hypothetical protein